MKLHVKLYLGLCLFFSTAVTAFAGGMASGPISITDLTARSETVVIGRVTSVQSDWNSTRTIIFTRIDLEVDEIFKGSISSGQISFYQTGGQVGDIASMIAGSPAFTPGEQALLFLSGRRDGRLGVVGLFQGKFSIERDAISGQEIVVRRVPGVARPLDRISLEQAKESVRMALAK